MTTLVLIQFGLSLLAALLGSMAGWWLRGRPSQVGSNGLKSAPADQKQVAATVLQSLQAAADTVRSCVEQHTECIRTIQSELHEATATEPAVITSAAESIIASNGLVQHQFNNIRTALDDSRKEIHDCLSGTHSLLFTFASLDRQKHVYAQVLSSLEVLAAELASDVKGHGRRLQKISGDLKTGEQTTAGIDNAVTQILDATNDVQQRVAGREEKIAAQAETIHMQAILTHADLLTSLPNRRAMEAELQRASKSSGRTPLCTLLLIDLDNFARVNNEYGHQGGDVILRQAAGIMKTLVRGRDMLARYGGDTFALLLSHTTLHDALPIAERVRTLLEEHQFSHGTRPLKVTASVGVAQLAVDEMRGPVVTRVEEALYAAHQAGGNVCYRHDGRQCHPVCSSLYKKHEKPAEESLCLASIWRDSTTNGSEPAAPAGAAAEENGGLSGRSLFAANLNRRLAEWKRGGPTVAVAVLRVDQMDDLIERFGGKAQEFLRQVMGRLLEAATREMDERCEFEDGLFALLLPGIDESSGLAIAERLRFQVRQCKIRMGNDLWDLTASIGLAQCTVADRVMDIMLSAEAAMKEAARQGGDGVCLAQPVQAPQTASA